MYRLFTQIEAVARSEASVLLWGETGTGKKALAAEVHRCAHAGRRSAQLVPVVCSGLSAAQLDADGLLDRVCAPAPIELPVGITLAEAEREVILRTLAAHGGNRTFAAETLKIARRTLYEKLAASRRAEQEGHAEGPCCH
jgi:DNA-binding NtrC family response regulator